MKPPIVIPAKDDYGTIVDFGHKYGEALLKGPDNRFAGADRGSGSAFAGKAASIASGPAIPPPTQSLFSRRAADTPAATGMSTGMQTGRDPRLAAPPATSRWWQAGQGFRPGFKDKPDATNLVNIRPLYLGGEQ
jgi:hypothetical protein